MLKGVNPDSMNSTWDKTIQRPGNQGQEANLVSGLRSIALRGGLEGQEREDEKDDGADEESLESHFSEVVDLATSPRREKVLSDDEAGQGDFETWNKCVCASLFYVGLPSSALPGRAFREP